MFTHFQKDPNREVCQTTETKRARCKTRPLKCAGGISPPGDVLTANHQILNLNDKSRNDRQNAVTVQDGYSYWIQSYPTETKDAA